MAYHCAQLQCTTQHETVLIIFHLILQTVVIAHLLSNRWMVSTWQDAVTDRLADSRLPSVIKKSSDLKVSFLANVNSRSRSLYAIARPSVVCRLSVCLSVCNVRAPYSGGSDFWQYFYGIRYLGHPWTPTENFTEIVPGEPLRRGS